MSMYYKVGLIKEPIVFLHDIGTGRDNSRIKEEKMSMY